MKISCGTDIIEVDRIKKSFIEFGAKFADKVFTEEEIEYCESKNKQKYQSYAARFAAKEAVFKAISELLKNKFDITWKDIEILNDDSGKPRVNLPLYIYNKIDNIDISISHCKEYAFAVAIILYKGEE